MYCLSCPRILIFWNLPCRVHVPCPCPFIILCKMYMDLKTMGFLPWSEFLLGIVVCKSCTGIPLIMVVYLIFLTSGGILCCLGDIAMYAQFAFFSFLRTVLHSHLACTLIFQDPAKFCNLAMDTFQVFK